MPELCDRSCSDLPAQRGQTRAIPCQDPPAIDVQTIARASRSAMRNTRPSQTALPVWRARGLESAIACRDRLSARRRHARRDGDRRSRTRGERRDDQRRGGAITNARRRVRERAVVDDRHAAVARSRPRAVVGRCYPKPRRHRPVSRLDHWAVPRDGPRNFCVADARFARSMMVRNGRRRPSRRPC